MIEFIVMGEDFVGDVVAGVGALLQFVDDVLI
jgi:hypothetical protein